VKRPRTARQIQALHDRLVFLEAFPPDRRTHAQARRELRRFARRSDLRRHRKALAGSGIAGTDTPFRFFWPTAHWISQEWPGALTIERDDPDHARAILEALPGLLDPARAEWLRQQRKPTLAVLDRMRPRGVTDADFLIGLVAAMPWDEPSREAFFDRMDPPFLLHAGRGTPDRTTARFPRGPLVIAAVPAPRDLRSEAGRAPRRIAALRGADARALIRLARASMITRERDLAVFQYPEPRDAFLVDDGYGLAFALIGAAASRRALLPATYGGLILRNRVPIGYIQLDVLGRHAAVSFNLFAEFRHGIAAWVFARLIAATHHSFGCDEFSIEPYQLGQGNDEGIDSGAWWFYHRQGFRPRAAAARRIAAREVARKAKRSAYRSSARTLRALAESHVFFTLDGARTPRLPRIDAWLDAGVRALSHFNDPDAERRQAAAARAAAGALGVAARAAERKAFERWAGIVLALTARGRWHRAELRALARIVRAKSSSSERTYQRLVLRHARLRRQLDC